MMEIYYIRTFANEDGPGCVCAYDREQYKEVVKMLLENHREFVSWVEGVHV